MVLASSDEQLEVRFAPYIEELHQLFSGCSQHFGAPEDIFALGERLTRPGVFRDEMSSLVRAVIYREHERITQADLLGLITAAVAGREVDLTEPEFRAPVRQLLTFVGAALRSLWRGFPEEPVATVKASAPLPATSAPTSVSHTVAQPTAAPVKHVFEEVEVRGTTDGRRANSLDKDTISLDESPFSRDGNASSSDMSASSPYDQTERSVVAKSSVFSRLRALWRDPEPAPAAESEDGSYPEYQPIAIFQARYRPLWIVGVCGVSFGLAAGLMLRNRPPLPRPPVQQSAQSSHPWSPPSAAPAYEQERAADPRANAAPSPVDTFQADNAALQAANAALRAANAVLPPLPEPARPSSVDPAPGPSAETTRISGTRPPGPGKPAARPSEAASAASVHNMAAQQGLSQPAYRTGTQPVSSLKASFRAPGQPVRSPFTEPMSGLSRPAPYAALRHFTPPAVQRPYFHAFPLSAPSEQARLATPMRPPAQRAFPIAPEVREHVFLSATGVMAANLLSAPAPEYPQLASSSQVQGRVIVQAVVGTDGGVIATRVLSGPQFLRASAENAVRRWRYRPYLVDGRPAVVATDAILNFELER